MMLLCENFYFNIDVEILIEVDFCEIDLDVFDYLCVEGFNCLSMGVQDFNKEVQCLVNCEQDEEFIFVLFNYVCDIGFILINIDLIYGLLKQMLESFVFMLKCVMELNFDCLSVFNYVYLLMFFVVQCKIKDVDLFSVQQKLDILQEMIVLFIQVGYQFIGMDYFVCLDDELVVVQCEGVLYCNFQGYMIQGDIDLLGMGVFVISMIGDGYMQNQKELKCYYQ